MTNSDWAKVQASPGKYNGCTVNLYVHVSDPVAQTANKEYLSYTGYPDGSPFDATVLTLQHSAGMPHLFAQITGTVDGRYQLQNAFGASFSVVDVKVSSLYIVSCNKAFGVQACVQGQGLAIP